MGYVGMDNEYFISINDVSSRLSVPAYTLRYWEKQFPSAIKPTTGAGGRRYYRPETFKRLKIIKDLLYTQGMTIAGVRKMLHNGEFRKIKQESVASENVCNINTNEIDNAILMLQKAKSLLES